jgi:hypothetical protein
MNKQILLNKRPQKIMTPDDFKLEIVDIPTIKDGEVLLKNSYLSIDAGFRFWMNEGSGNNILPAMALGQPVQGVVLGTVIESKNPSYKQGDKLMTRCAWQEYSVITAENDTVYPLPTAWECDDSLYLGVLGETGMSAYIGTVDMGQLKKGDTALISAAAGAAGIVAGQIAKINGAKVIGITSSDQKSQKLINEFGFDRCLNYKSSTPLSELIADECPDGVDYYFDSVGGQMLEDAIANIAQNGRIALCGAIANYSSLEPQLGPKNLFNLVARQASMKGLMTHYESDRYDEMRGQLFKWMQQGTLKNAESCFEGIEHAPAAFCGMFTGNNFGKTIIKL